MWNEEIFQALGAEFGDVVEVAQGMMEQGFF